MTDRELEILFNSIKSVDELQKDLNNSESVILDDKLSLIKNGDKIEIEINRKTYNLKKDAFNSILNEFRQQEIQDQLNKNRKPEFRADQDLQQLDENTFYAHEELLTNIWYASQASGGQGFYKKKIAEISKLLKSGKTLSTDNRIYKSWDEFDNSFVSKCG